MEQKYPDDALHKAFWKKKSVFRSLLLILQTLSVEIRSVESLGHDASMGTV